MNRFMKFDQKKKLKTSHSREPTETNSKKFEKR